MEAPRQKIPRPATHPLTREYQSHLPLPKREFSRDDLIVGSKSGLEQRATEIKMSSVNIIDQSRGRTRVARQNRPISPRPNEIEPSESEHKEALCRSMNRLNPNESSYNYKPPASTRYFLWDSTRTGTTIFSQTKDIVPKTGTINDPAMKACGLYFLKKDILQAAKCTINDYAFFLAKISKNHLRVDRFDIGKLINGVKTPMGYIKGDIIVYIIEKSLNSYEYMMNLVLGRMNMFEQDCNFPFPVFCFVERRDQEIDKITCKYKLNSSIDITFIQAFYISDLSFAYCQYRIKS
jgi:hypothetical protein